MSNKKFSLTTEQIEWLKENHNQKTYKEMGVHFRCNWTTIRKYCMNNGYTKTEEERKAVNKRLFQVTETTHQRIIVDREGVQQVYLSTCKRGKLLSRYNYETYIGPLTDDERVIHKDGNTLNCDPSNLEKVSRYMLMMQKGQRKYKPLTEEQKKRRIEWIKQYREQKRKEKQTTPLTPEEKEAKKKAQYERKKAMNKAYYFRNKEKISAYHKDYFQKNKETYYQRRRSKPKAEKAPRMKKEKVKKVVERKITSAINKRQAIRTTEKRVEKVFKIKTVDTSKLVKLVIDKKTILYVKPDADMEQIKTKYLEMKQRRLAV